MKTKITLGIGIFLGLLVLSAIAFNAVALEEKTEEQKMLASLSEETKNAGFVPVSFERRNVVDNIYEYTIVLKVGKGKFDRIGIHRVVKEKKPWQPIKTKDAVMMIHGDASNFRIAFLGSKESDEIPDEQSSAVYFAKQKIDVWGIDERWTFVPAGLCKLTGCKFMKNWDTITHIQDIRVATEFANLIRKLEDNDRKDNKRKMTVLGYSGGGQLAIALANQEATLPEKKKIVGKLIIWETIYKQDPNATIFTCTDYLDPATCEDVNAREAAAANYQVLEALYNSGVYYSEEGFGMNIIASLADGNLRDYQSPFEPNLTNWQMAMTVLSATYFLIQPPMAPPASFYHYNAGIFDQNGTAVGLRFTNPEYMVDLGMKVPPYQSLGELIDREAIVAGESTPYDDHLSEITVPVCYFGAGGGMGSYGIYTIELLGSQDKKVSIISILPERQLDFGHADLGYAQNATELVWRPTAECIKH